MESKRKEKYYQLLEKLIDTMTDPTNLNREDFSDMFKDVDVHYGITKSVTEFYKTITQERAGDGETLVEFDSGRGDKVILQKRLVTPSSAVVKCTLYTSKEAAPLDDDEMKQLDVMMRTYLSLVSRNRLQQAIERMGFYDENGFPNLRSFRRYLDVLSEGPGLFGYTAVCFNLRHFTLINQEIGREKADLVMQNYFNLISSIIGNNGMVFRMGGDNFVGIFKNELTENVIVAFQGAPIAYDDNNEKRVEISASAGLFCIPEGFVYDRSGVIMDRIVSASIIARQGEKGSIIFYEETFLDTKARSMMLQARMSQAIQDCEYIVYYQPKVDIRTGNMIGAEALCRWCRDDRIISPNEFIPYLEQSMDICRLDFYMLDKVCSDIRRWLAAGRKVVKISINLSRKHLVDADLLDHIMEVIDKYEVPHRYIEIELTETTTEVGFNQLKKIVAGLESEGIYTAVDDFGIGYSSLNLIREIPWNVLKIDKCFLPNDDEKKSSTNNLMFSHVVAMARDLGLECITEGVETPKQVETLKQCRCFFAQGYAFDPPLTVAEFEKKLDNPHYEIP